MFANYGTRWLRRLHCVRSSIRGALPLCCWHHLHTTYINLLCYCLADTATYCLAVTDTANNSSDTKLVCTCTGAI